jgi:tRNA(fMet)-specific endonuclease VapC
MASGWAGKINLRKEGFTPAFADAQIAAVAAVNGLILETRNTDDFSRFLGLQLINWFD